jgi:hypothetical protein
MRGQLGVKQHDAPGDARCEVLVAAVEEVAEQVEPVIRRWIQA